MEQGDEYYKLNQIFILCLTQFSSGGTCYKIKYTSVWEPSFSYNHWDV